jgi:hypothetical protein
MGCLTSSSKQQVVLSKSYARHDLVQRRMLPLRKPCTLGLVEERSHRAEPVARWCSALAAGNAAILFACLGCQRRPALTPPGIAKELRPHCRPAGARNRRVGAELIPRTRPRSNIGACATQRPRQLPSTAAPAYSQSQCFCASARSARGSCEARTQCLPAAL